MSNKNIPYYMVAKQALINWNGLSEEEATKTVETSGFEELESQVYAVGSMEYGINEILKQAKIGLGYHGDIKNAIYGAPNFDEYDRDEQFGYLIHAIKREGLDPNQLIMDTLSAVHNGWVKDNQKKFMARDKKYQHMPIELIGWKETKADLLFVRPIFEACNVKVDEKVLEEVYNTRVLQFLEEHQISSEGDLIQIISKGDKFYPALEGQEDIIQALQDPKFVAERVISGIRDKGIGTNEQISQQLFRERVVEGTDELEVLRAQKQKLMEEDKKISEVEKLINTKENQGPNLDE